MIGCFEAESTPLALDALCGSLGLLQKIGEDATRPTGFKRLKIKNFEVGKFILCASAPSDHRWSPPVAQSRGEWLLPC